MNCASLLRVRLPAHSCKRIFSSPSSLSFRQYSLVGRPPLLFSGGGLSRAPLQVSRPPRRALTGGGGGGGTAATPPPPKRTFLQYWLSHKEIPPRYTVAWWGEIALIFTVFGVTGSTTAFLVRPFITTLLQLEGTMKDGPWAYRVGTIVVMFPVYPVLLVTFGTLAGRHTYFRHFAVKMLARFGIPKHLLDKNPPTEPFRKW